MQSTKADQLSFTRTEFYDKIWSIPSEKFAAELGISDAALRKVCQKYRIPKPYPGYWSKRRNDQSPHQTELPNTNAPQLQTLTFEIKPPALPAYKPSPNDYDGDIKRLLDTANSLPRLVVPDIVTDPHPLVVSAEQTHRNDRQSFTDRQFNGFKGYKNALAIDVIPPQLGRALRIMDAIIRRVESIGGRVELQAERSERPRIHTVIVFGKEPIATMRVRETFKKIRIPPPTDGSWLSRRSEIIPTGLLVVDHGPSVNRSPHLKDTAVKHRIEDQLHDWLIDLIHKVAKLRHQRCLEKTALELEKEQRRQQAARDRAERTQLRRFKAKQKEARDRLDALVEDATSWRKSQLIRDYVREFEIALQAGKCLLPMGQCAEDYLAWARAEADRLDPFAFSPPSVQEEVFVPMHDAPTK
jgi:hypothetical protein